MAQMQLSTSQSVVQPMSLGGLQWLMTDRMEAVTRILTKAQGWSVGEHVNYDGDAIVVAFNEESGHTFVLSGEDAIGLTRVYEDRMVACGTFVSMEAALDALGRAVHEEQV